MSTAYELLIKIDTKLSLIFISKKLYLFSSAH